MIQRTNNMEAIFFHKQRFNHKNSLGDTNLINGCTGPTDPPGWVLKRKSFFCMGQSFPTDPIILVPLENFFLQKFEKIKQRNKN